MALSWPVEHRQHWHFQSDFPDGFYQATMYKIPVREDITLQKQFFLNNSTSGSVCDILLRFTKQEREQE